MQPNLLTAPGIEPVDFARAEIGLLPDIELYDRTAWNAGLIATATKPGDFPGATVDLNNLDPAQGFGLFGSAHLSLFGISVADGGDVNGDGLSDMLIGSPGANVAYLVFGAASGLDSTNLAHLDGTNGCKLVAGASNVGAAVDFAGDINGDGFGDMVIAAPAYGGGAGRSYVVFGKASGFDPVIHLDQLDGTDGFKITGVDNQAAFRIAAAGDVNGDGYADVMINGFFDSPNGYRSGAVYLLFGKASGFDALEDISNLNGIRGFELDGTIAGAWAGFSARAAGDVNGDGYGDLIVGAPYVPGGSLSNSAGAAYVLFGKASGFDAKPDLSSLDGTDGFRLDGVGKGDEAGVGVASAGDINGDGFDDLIVGADGSKNGGSYAGAAYLVFGHAGGFDANLDLADLDGQNGFRMIGEAGDGSGFSVASAGDVNGDGYGDFVVGGWGQDGYVIYGKASGFSASLNLTQLQAADGYRILGQGDFSGMHVNQAGDLNGDGLSDLIIGANGWNAGGQLDGATFVIYGQGPAEAVNRIGTEASQVLAGGAFDDSLSGLGGDDHLYGNGGDDTLVGGAGADWLNGGDGVDTASYTDAAAGVNVSLALTNPQNTGGAGVDTLTGIENLVGSGFDDRLIGDNRANVLEGGLGDDVLNGGGGIDLASYASSAAGVEVALGGGSHDTHGAGFDTFISIEGLVGSNFDDRLTGDAGRNSLAGGGGDDLLVGGEGKDVLDGGDGTDTASYLSADAGVTVSLAAKHAQQTGGAGADTLVSIEVLQGSNHADVLTGLALGAFTLLGADGDDRLVIAHGDTNASLEGGKGVDIADWSGFAGDGLTIDLRSGTAADSAGIQAQLVGIEGLIGSQLADQLIGGATGNALFGGGGDDSLDGGKGSDTLNGGLGADQMTGGKGDDLFRFAAGDASTDGQDIIVDFHSGSDKIDLTSFGVTFTFVDAFDGAANEIVLSKSHRGVLVSIDLDGDGASDFALDVGVAHHTLEQTDFLT